MIAILYLVLTRVWFDAIDCGEKTIEYRERKPYWTLRLLTKNGTPRRFDIIEFKNGYGDRPTMRFAWGGTEIEPTRFAIKIGKRL